MHTINQDMVVTVTHHSPKSRFHDCFVSRKIRVRYSSVSVYESLGEDWWFQDIHEHKCHQPFGPLRYSGYDLALGPAIQQPCINECSQPLTYVWVNFQGFWAAYLLIWNSADHRKQFAKKLCLSAIYFTHHWQVKWGTTPGIPVSNNNNECVYGSHFNLPNIDKAYVWCSSYWPLPAIFGPWPSYMATLLINFLTATCCCCCR